MWQHNSAVLCKPFLWQDLLAHSVYLKYISESLIPGLSTNVRNVVDNFTAEIVCKDLAIKRWHHQRTVLTKRLTVSVLTGQWTHWWGVRTIANRRKMLLTRWWIRLLTGLLSAPMLATVAALVQLAAVDRSTQCLETTWRHCMIGDKSRKNSFFLKLPFL